MKITFEHTITTVDLHQHIPHVFAVPAGTTQIHMEFTYQPRYGTGKEYQIN